MDLTCHRDLDHQRTGGELLGPSGVCRQLGLVLHAGRQSGRIRIHAHQRKRLSHAQIEFYFN